MLTYPTQSHLSSVSHLRLQPSNNLCEYTKASFGSISTVLLLCYERNTNPTNTQSVWCDASATCTCIHVRISTVLVHATFDPILHLDPPRSSFAKPWTPEVMEARKIACSTTEKWYRNIPEQISLSRPWSARDGSVWLVLPSEEAWAWRAIHATTILRDDRAFFTNPTRTWDGTKASTTT